MRKQETYLYFRVRNDDALFFFYLSIKERQGKGIKFDSRK